VTEDGGGVLRKANLRVTSPRVALYERRVEGNHHHVVCRTCGRVEDVDSVVEPAPCLEVSDSRGFVVDEAPVTWWGLCPGCAAST
jgi:Fe2+ or Zn2+ uptake regulation protein